MKPLSMKNHGTQVYPQEHKYLRVTWWLGDLTSALEQTPNPWPKGRLTITWNKKEKSNLKPAIVVDSIGFSRKIGWSHSHSKNAPGMMDKIRERAQIQLLAREQRLQPFNWQNLGIALSAQPDPSIQNRKHYVDIEPTTKSKKFRGQEPVFSSTPSTTGPTTPPNQKKTSKHQTSNFQVTRCGSRLPLHWDVPPPRATMPGIVPRRRRSAAPLVAPAPAPH